MKLMFTLSIILSVQFPHKVSAQNIPHPNKPSCQSSDICKQQAIELFNIILNTANGILAANKDPGYICFQLSRIISLYEDLKLVDFNLLPITSSEKKSAFDSLYMIGEINVPSLDFCGIQKGSGSDKRNNLSFITPYVKNVTRDVSSALKILKAQQPAKSGGTA